MKYDAADIRYMLKSANLHPPTRQRLDALADATENLSAQERDVLSLRMQGLSSRFVARKLHYCPRHVERIQAGAIDKIVEANAMGKEVAADGSQDSDLP